MAKLSFNQWVGVFVGLAFIIFIFFGGYFMNIFKDLSNPSANNALVLPQSGVETRDVIVGQGDIAVRGDTLTVHYVGMLPDGKVFDSSLDTGIPFQFTLGAGRVIKGWDEGLIGMRVGGRRQLIIAPDYAYGSQGIGTVPPNSTLIFEVELLSIQRPSTESGE